MPRMESRRFQSRLQNFFRRKLRLSSRMDQWQNPQESKSSFDAADICRAAYFGGSIAAFEKDIERLREFGSKLETKVCKKFVNNGGTISFPSDSELGNALLTLPSQQFDFAVVGISSKIFYTPWGRSYLFNIWKSVREGGWIAVPIDNAAKSLGWSLEKLEEFFSGQPEKIDDGYALFRVQSGHEPYCDRSTLTWFRENALSLLTVDFLIRSAAIDADVLPDDETLLNFLGSKGGDAVDYRLESASAKRRGIKREGFVFQEELNKAATRHSYSVVGTGYKAAAIKRIVDEYFPGRKGGVAHCDLGGGYGLVGAELLLDSSCAIVSTVTVDLNPINMRLSAELKRTWSTEFGDEFTFWLGSYFDYPFTQAPHVITLLGSLLYLSPQNRPALIGRCWDALPEGGVLIVHENIRNKQYTHDYEAMFTVEEIDGLLERFGPVRRFSSDSIMEVSKEEAGNKSVFRVLRKRSNDSVDKSFLSKPHRIEPRRYIFETLIHSLAESNYPIVPIRKVDECVDRGQPAIFIKHDIHDVPLRSVVEMAEFEKSFGASGSYFFLPQHHPRVKKAYEFQEQSEVMKVLQEMGNDVGIHIDPYYLMHSRSRDLRGALLEIIEEFAENDVPIVMGNMHGNSAFQHADLNGYGTSFDLFRELSRQHDFPQLSNVPGPSAEIIRNEQMSLEDLGMRFWGDMPLWSASHKFVATNFVTDNKFGARGTFELLQRAETTGAYYLFPKMVPGSRNLPKGGRSVGEAACADNLNKHFALDDPGFREILQKAAPLLVLLHPEFYS